MPIIVPEITIKNTLETVIKYYHTDLLEKEAIFVVDDATIETSTFTIVVTQQSTATLPEITDVTTVADVASNLNNLYWFLNTPFAKFFVWYNVSGNGVAPIIPERLGIEIAIDQDDTALDVAIKTAFRLNLFANFDVPVPTTPTMTITGTELDATRGSLLFNIFGDLKFDNMNYFKQMSSILKNRYSSEKRKLEITLGFDANRTNFPTISILLPNEESNPKQTGVTGGDHNHFDGQRSDLSLHYYSTVYNLLITSDNQNEVILVYHFIKTMLLTALNQFSLQGIQNLWVSGRDITLDFDLTPNNVFHRTVAMSFFYENEIPDIERISGVTGIIFTSTPSV